jgi:hypothetical protein
MIHDWLGQLHCSPEMIRSKHGIKHNKTLAVVVTITSGAMTSLSKQASDRIVELLKCRLLCTGRCTVPGRNVHALRPEPHRDLLLKARVCPVLSFSTDTCGRGNLNAQRLLQAP